MASYYFVSHQIKQRIQKHKEKPLKRRTRHTYHIWKYFSGYIRPKTIMQILIRRSGTMKLDEREENRLIQKATILTEGRSQVIYRSLELRECDWRLEIVDCRVSAIWRNQPTKSWCFRLNARKSSCNGRESWQSDKIRSKYKSIMIELSTSKIWML